MNKTIRKYLLLLHALLGYLPKRTRQGNIWHILLLCSIGNLFSSFLFASEHSDDIKKPDKLNTTRFCLVDIQGETEEYLCHEYIILLEENIFKKENYQYLFESFLKTDLYPYTDDTLCISFAFVNSEGNLPKKRIDEEDFFQLKKTPSAAVSFVGANAAMDFWAKHAPLLHPESSKAQIEDNKLLALTIIPPKLKDPTESKLFSWSYEALGVSIDEDLLSHHMFTHYTLGFFFQLFLFILTFIYGFWVSYKVNSLPYKAENKKKSNQILSSRFLLPAPEEMQESVTYLMHTPLPFLPKEKNSSTLYMSSSTQNALELDSYVLQEVLGKEALFLDQAVLHQLLLHIPTTQKGLLEKQHLLKVLLQHPKALDDLQATVDKSYQLLQDTTTFFSPDYSMRRAKYKEYLANAWGLPSSWYWAKWINQKQGAVKLFFLFSFVQQCLLLNKYLCHFFLSFCRKKHVKHLLYSLYPDEGFAQTLSNIPLVQFIVFFGLIGGSSFFLIWNGWQGVQDILNSYQIMKELQTFITQSRGLLEYAKKCEEILKSKPALQETFAPYLIHTHEVLHPKDAEKEYIHLLEQFHHKKNISPYHALLAEGDILRSYLLIDQYMKQWHSMLLELSHIRICLRLVQHIRNSTSSHPFTFPKILSREEAQGSTYLEAKNAWHTSLLHPIVYPSLSLSQRVHTRVLSGHNKGGKTAYMTTYAKLFVWMGLGIVPAQEAVMAPIDLLFLHKDIQDNIHTGESLYSEEIKNIKQGVFRPLKKIGKKAIGVLFFDEPIHSTNEEDAKDIFIQSIWKPLCKSYPNLSYFITTHHTKLLDEFESKPGVEFWQVMLPFSEEDERYAFTLGRSKEPNHVAARIAREELSEH